MLITSQIDSELSPSLGEIAETAVFRIMCSDRIRILRSALRK